MNCIVIFEITLSFIILHNKINKDKIKFTASKVWEHKILEVCLSNMKAMINILFHLNDYEQCEYIYIYNHMRKRNSETLKIIFSVKKKILKFISHVYFINLNTGEHFKYFK